MAYVTRAVQMVEAMDVAGGRPVPDEWYGVLIADETEATACRHRSIMAEMLAAGRSG